MNKKKVVCPECAGNIFHEDTRKQEISCRQCGLVLIAPFVQGLVFPGYKVVPRKKHLSIDAYKRCFHISYNLIS